MTTLDSFEDHLTSRRTTAGPMAARAGTLIAVAATLGLVIGCNTPVDGANNNIQFTPNDCGRGQLGCDFEDSIGVGGVINVHISGINGFSTAGVNLTSDDERVLTVIPVPDVAGQPTWELFGAGAGVARLVALDASGAEADFLEVPVQNLSGLGMKNILGDAVGPATDDPSYHEVWTVNADMGTSLTVMPLIGEGVTTMGRYVYTATVHTPGLETGFVEGNELSDGYAYFDVPAGDYELSFEDDFGHAIDILIQAQ